LPHVEVDVSATGVATVAVRGEVIDPPEAEHLYTELCAIIERGVRRLDLDLAAVPVLGSAGINALIRAHNAGRALRCTVCLVAASRLVRRALHVTGVDELLFGRSGHEG
jgi:anti-anti-sigma factor